MRPNIHFFADAIKFPSRPRKFRPNFWVYVFNLRGPTRSHIKNPNIITPTNPFSGSKTSWQRFEHVLQTATLDATQKADLYHIRTINYRDLGPPNNRVGNVGDHSRLCSGPNGIVRKWENRRWGEKRQMGDKPHARSDF